MRYLLLALVLAAGCQGVRGPFAPRSPVRVDDPYLSISEQQKLGRERLALPESSKLVLPPEAGIIPGR